MNHTFKITSWIFILLSVAVLQNGCAALKPKPLPDTTSPLSIAVTDQFPDSWDFDIKKIDVAVELGDKDKTSSSGILYFPMGRIIVVGTDLSDSAKKSLWKEKDQLTLAPIAEAKESLLKELSGQTGRFSFSENPGGDLVQTIPGICMDFTEKDKARLWVSVDGKITNPHADDGNWGCLYIAGVDEARSLNGSKGWNSHGQELFKKAVSKGFRLAYRTLLDDLDGKIRNEKAPKVTLTFPWPFDFKPVPKEVQLLKNAEGGTMVLSSPENGEDTTILILPKSYPVTSMEPAPNESSQ